MFVRYYMFSSFFHQPNHNQSKHVLLTHFPKITTFPSLPRAFSLSVFSLKFPFALSLLCFALLCPCFACPCFACPVSLLCSLLYGSPTTNEFCRRTNGCPAHQKSYGGVFTFFSFSFLFLTTAPATNNNNSKLTTI